MHVNPGGGPDRDDTGLPPVDVEIPDDARELDRDVQAYRREQRAQRRRLRSGRLQTVVSRDGMVMPLLICCLIFALITGTLLTFFTSTSLDQAGLPGSGAKPGGKPASPGASAPSLGPPVATPAPVLGTVRVQVAGRTRAVSTLGPAVLLVASKDCRCNGAISAVAGQAARAREAVYLVSGSGSSTGLGHGIRAATDVSGGLASYQYAGLTAILVTEVRLRVLRAAVAGQHEPAGPHSVRLTRGIAAWQNLPERDRRANTTAPARSPPAMVATLCDVLTANTRASARGEHAVISSARTRRHRQGVPLRRLLLASAAALLPVLAGCEAGNQAPTLNFHVPTDAQTASAGSLLIRNVFVLGAPLGEKLQPGGTASLFFSVLTTSGSDRLVSISAPGSASSVQLPGGGLNVTTSHPVLLNGPQTKAFLVGLTRKITGGVSDHDRAAFPAGGRRHREGRAGHGQGGALRDLRPRAEPGRLDREHHRAQEAPRDGDNPADALAALALGKLAV